ncbi:MAG TPA: hypothetical protein H9879_07085 [Candidatus Alistipes intestinipullorum]|nr:hypothetical protein [Candidatus Alistipes intestinipullorum]
MILREVDAATLHLDEKAILDYMGIHDGTPDEMTRKMIGQMRNLLQSAARPKYCYRIVREINFHYGKIIADALKDGDRFAVVVATAGEEIDCLLHDLRNENIAKAFVADTIASELAEATLREAILDIERHTETGEKLSNPYSPGYCGWALTEQRKLFALFGEDPCGVHLNDSCLMLPIKSISSVIAIGPRVVKAPYGCEICTKPDCYKKRPTR